jgi:general secretion pathway protein C
MSLATRLKLWFSSGRGSRPPLEAYYIYIFALILGFWISDLALISIRPKMLPTKAPPSRPNRSRNARFVARSEYNPITDRNIFSLDGQIPPPLSAGDNGNQNDDGPAVPSQLPIVLSGTIVHVDPRKSVATVNLKTKNATKAYRVADEIEGMAKITKIERTRLTFRNLNNSRLEYVEIVSEGKINFGMNAPHAEVEARGDFDHSVKREDIKKYTADLSGVLNQARMIPNVIPGTGGQVAGFRFVSIQPGSIYEKLGFKPDDVIKAVNGEPVNSPTKAMELYQTLKTENKIEMTVERNGRDETMTYTVTE